MSKEKIEFIRYTGKNYKIKDDCMAGDRVLMIDMRGEPFDKLYWPKGQWPPKKVKITIEVVD